MSAPVVDLAAERERRRGPVPMPARRPDMPTAAELVASERGQHTGGRYVRQYRTKQGPRWALWERDEDGRRRRRGTADSTAGWCAWLGLDAEATAWWVEHDGGA